MARRPFAIPRGLQSIKEGSRLVLHLASRNVGMNQWGIDSHSRWTREAPSDPVQSSPTVNIGSTQSRAVV